jgi:hypothetical protein
MLLGVGAVVLVQSAKNTPLVQNNNMAKARPKPIPPSICAKDGIDAKE